MQKNSTSVPALYKSLSFMVDDGYRVGKDGSVWSRRRAGTRGVLKSWRQIKPSLVKGYPQISLQRNGKGKCFKVHRLVLLTFVGPCPEGQQCRHLNGIKTDNRLENLCWGTAKEDWEDKRRHGTDSTGERNPRAKLTEDQVREIRRLYATKKYRQVDLAEQFSIDQTVISDIVRRVMWKCVE